MVFDFDKHYDFDPYYTREKDLTYTNRFTNKEKWVAALFCVVYFVIAAFLIGVAIYVVFWQSLIWPLLIIVPGILFITLIAIAITKGFRDILNHKVSIELNPTGFTQTIKYLKTQETQELYLP